MLCTAVHGCLSTSLLFPESVDSVLRSGAASSKSTFRSACLSIALNRRTDSRRKRRPVSAQQNGRITAPCQCCAGERYGDLSHATWELVRFEDELAGDIGKVRELIAVARAIRDVTGPGRSVAEQKITDTLKGIAWTCCGVLEEAGVPQIPDLAAADTLISELRRSILIVAEPRDYALNAFVSWRGRGTALPEQDVDNLSRSSALPVACLIFRRLWTWPGKQSF
jgi:hypothetical protein